MNRIYDILINYIEETKVKSNANYIEIIETLQQLLNEIKNEYK